MINMTPLHCAALSENPEIVKLLLSFKNIDVNAQTKIYQLITCNYQIIY